MVVETISYDLDSVFAHGGKMIRNMNHDEDIYLSYTRLLLHVAVKMAVLII